jgi:hypothetical protein
MAKPMADLRKERLRTGSFHHSMPRLGRQPSRREGAMAEIVNLNRYRKQRDRKEKAKDAAENRVRHGRRKLERDRDHREQERAAKELDDKRLD